MACEEPSASAASSDGDFEEVALKVLRKKTSTSKLGLEDQ